MILGFVVTGCSPEVSKATVSGGQFSDVKTGEMADGFVEGGFVESRDFVEGRGGFGDATLRRKTSIEGEIYGDYLLQRSGKKNLSCR